jgi:hypothetical protein
MKIPKHILAVAAALGGVVILSTTLSSCTQTNLEAFQDAPTDAPPPRRKPANARLVSSLS